MGAKAMMIVPDFDLEAQSIKLYRFTAQEAPKEFKTIQAGVAPPDFSIGLTPPQTRHERLQSGT